MVLFQVEKLLEFQFKESGKLLFHSLNFSSWSHLNYTYPLTGGDFSNGNIRMLVIESPFWAVIVCWHSLGLADIHHWLVPLLRCCPTLFGDSQNIQLLMSHFWLPVQFPSDSVYLPSFSWTGFAPGRMTYWTEPQTSSMLEGLPLLWFVYKSVPNEATLHCSATKQAYPASLSILFLASRGMYQIQINKSNLNLAKQIVD